MTPVVEIRSFPATLSLGKVNIGLTAGLQSGVDGGGVFQPRRRWAQVYPGEGGVGDVGVISETHSKLTGQLTVVVQRGPGLGSCNGCQCCSGDGGGGCDCIFFSAVVRLLAADGKVSVLRLPQGVTLKQKQL